MQPDVGMILRSRARLLAREPGATQITDALELVEFALAQEKYAVESSFVREIHALANLTPLPCTPEFVLGVVNLRGKIVSVVDIKTFFDLPEKGLTDLNKVIVLESETMCFGILADAVSGVRRVPAAAIQPSLPTLTGIRDQYLKGITPERAIILDAAELLRDQSIVVQEQIAG